MVIKHKYLVVVITIIICFSIITSSKTCFAQEAGISPVMVSEPYKPSYTIAEAQPIPVTGNDQPSGWVPAIAGILFIFMIGSLLIIYILFKAYRKNILS